MENIAYASFQQRLLAKSIDIFGSLIVAVLLAAIVVNASFPEYIPGVVWISYLLFADGLGNGQSLGKRFIKIQVVSKKNLQPSGYIRSIIRNIFLFDFVVLVGAAIDWIVWGSTERRVGDWAANTCVISLKN